MADLPSRTLKSSYILDLAGNDHGFSNKISITGTITTSTSSETETPETKEVTYTLSPNHLRLKKEMYKPGEIEMEFILDEYDASTMNYVDIIKTEFITNEYTISIINHKQASDPTKETTDHTYPINEILAENYVVHDVKLRYALRQVLDGDEEKHIAEKNVMTVVVKAYSPDYDLTLEKYCQVYRGERLSRIIRDKSSLLRSYKDLRLCNTTVKQEKYFPVELIQPYLVQYNESFYDFAVRVAHRCGEPFYYESGELILGADKNFISNVCSTKPTDLKGRDDVTETIYHFNVQEFKKNENEEDAPVEALSDVISSQKIENIQGEISLSKESDIKYVDNFAKSLLSSNYTEQETAESGVRRRDENISLDDTLRDITTDDSITATEMEDSHWFEVGHEMLKATGVADILAKGGSKAADIPIQANFAVSVPLGANTNNIKITDEEVGASVKYSSAMSECDYQNLTNKFYDWIEKTEQKVAANIQKSHRTELTYEDALLLGQFVEINSLGVHYIYAVDLNIDTSYESGHSGSKDNLQAGEEGGNPDDPTTDHGIDLEVTYCPLQSDSSRATGITYQEKIFPPTADIPHIRKAEPQHAVISNVADPLRNGRVQIRYPWQKRIVIDADKNTYTESSPWISFVTPFTGSKDSGLLMTPDVDDYVMVNYEGGNIERPYVDGSIFHGEKASTNWGSLPIGRAKNNYRNPHRAITSDGSGITFIPGDASWFTAGMFPSCIGWMITGLSAAKEADITKNKRLGGSLVLSDYYGMYSIAMSSCGRSIDIDSPWGSVGINAFTGITLNAPNGDIKISGKNVTIEAGNKVSITSGTNIKEKGQGEEWSKVAGQLLGSIGGSFMKAAANNWDEMGVDPTKLFDVSFLRSVYEIMMRPVDGSLTLTSKRNLMIKAGKGNITTPAHLLSKVSKASKKDIVKLGLRNTFKGLCSGELSDANNATPQATPNELQRVVADLITAKCNEIDLKVREISNLVPGMRVNVAIFEKYFDSKGKKKPRYIKEGTNYADLDKLMEHVVTPPQNNEFAPDLDNNAILNKVLKLFYIKPELVDGQENDMHFRDSATDKQKQVYIEDYKKLRTAYNALCSDWTTIKNILEGGADQEGSLKNVISKDTGSVQRNVIIQNPNQNANIQGVEQPIVEGQQAQNNGPLNGTINIEGLWTQTQIQCDAGAIVTANIVQQIFGNGDAEWKKLKNLLERRGRIIRANKMFKRSLVYFILNALHGGGAPEVELTDENGQWPTTVEPLIGDNADKNWANFISHIKFRGGKDPSASGSKWREVASGALAGSGLDNIMSYDPDKNDVEFLGGIQTLFNLNGKAGPRAMWDVSQGGAILMSSNSRYTMQLNDDGDGQWKKIVNPQPSLQEILNSLNLS